MKIIVKCPECRAKIQVGDILGTGPDTEARLKKAGVRLVIQCPQCGNTFRQPLYQFLKDSFGFSWLVTRIKRWF
jgi:RNase P subunit RPR2